jgi:hypothetical protein
MGGAALPSVLRVAGCPSPSHRCRPFVLVAISSLPSHRRHPIVVVLDDVNVDVVFVVVVVVTAVVVFHFPIVVVAIAVIIVVGVVVVAVAIVIDIVARRRRACRACRAPWLSIQGIRPNQAKAVSPMAWGWSASPWICRRVADGVARTTSCQRCRPVGNIMVLSPGGWEERYPTVLGIYSFVKLRERRLRNCAGKFLE